MRTRITMLCGLALLATALGADEAPSRSPEFEKAWELHSQGKSAKAAFQKILDDESALEKERFNSAYLLAVIALGEKSPDRATTFLDRAEEILPDRPQVAVRRAEVHLLRQEYKEALKLLKGAQKSLRSMKSSDHYYRQQMVMARLEHATGGTKAAVARLEKLTKRFRGRWETHFTAGTYCEKLDDPRRALAHYEATIGLDPGRDPFPGIYAYQRWAAVSISSDPASYGKKPLVKQAVERYQVFLERARANKIPREFVQKVTQAKDVLEQFGAR